MKIVIAGAGSIGYHLAQLLSKENQDITLIDNEEELLESISGKLDVMTISGDAASINTLKDANVGKADLFIAVTTSQETNLLTAILAKQKGAKRTIARVDNIEYLSKEQKEYFSKIGIDKIICPHNFAANEIKRLINRASLTDIFEFENGKISIVGFTIDNNSRLIGTKVSDIFKNQRDITFRGVALLRDHVTIIPKGRTELRKGDHLYMSLTTKSIDKITPFLGKQSKEIKNIMIIGDTPLAMRTAKVLQDKYNVTVIMKNKKHGNKFVKELNHVLVTIADPNNKESLQEEGIANMDAFIALTPDSEVNILSSLVAEEYGVYKTIALVDNELYTHISQNIGIDTIINKKLITANNIFRYVRKGKVEAIATLHGVEAEIIEFEISKSNRVTTHRINELKLPEACIVAGVIRNESSIIPTGEFKLQLKDKVIVFALPQAIKTVENIFK